MSTSARWFELNIRSIEAELDAIHEHYQRAINEHEATRPKRFKLGQGFLFRDVQLRLYQDYKAVLGYWREQLTAALAVQQQHHQAADGLCDLSEVPIQCKAATLDQ